MTLTVKDEMVAAVQHKLELEEYDSECDLCNVIARERGDAYKMQASELSRFMKYLKSRGY